MGVPAVRDLLETSGSLLAGSYGISGDGDLDGDGGCLRCLDRGMYGDEGLLSGSYGRSRDVGLYGHSGFLRYLDGVLYGDGGLLTDGHGGDDGHRAVLLHRRCAWGFLGALQKVMGQWI